MTLIDAGNCIRIEQERAGMPSVELARLTGSSPQQVIRWRNNKNIKLHTMQEIAKALGVSLFVLISNDLPC